MATSAPASGCWPEESITCPTTAVRPVWAAAEPPNSKAITGSTCRRITARFDIDPPFRVRNASLPDSHHEDEVEEELRWPIMRLGQNTRKAPNDPGVNRISRPA